MTELQLVSPVLESDLPEKVEHCVLATEKAQSVIKVDFSDKAKSQITRKLVNLLRQHRIDYDGFTDICERVRKKLALRRPKRGRKLPQLLTSDEVDQYFKAIINVEHEIMLKVLLYTSVRVHELVNIKVGDLYLDECKIRIEQGKGAKDRYVLFPTSLKLVLASHRSAHPDYKYLFESGQHKQFSVRRIQQIMAEYGVNAGIEKRVRPHLFRHQMLTDLTRSGLSDSQIQLISGHASKKSLEIYQHLGLESVDKAYQQAVKSLGI
jgi:integrase/recombinase XerD